MRTSPHWGKLGLLIVLALGMYALVSRLDIDGLLDPERIADWLHSAGPFGPILFMGLMSTAVVISPIPSLPLDLAAGAAFGPLMGTAYAVLGAEVGAIASFLIGRALGREMLTELLHIDITFCERCSDRHLAIFVFLARLVPLFSFDVISYGAGLTNMSLRVFALVTFFGMIPPTLALTYAGSQIVSDAWLTIVSGLIMAAMLLLIPKLTLRHPTARWVQLLRGETPVSMPQPADKAKSHSPCPSCGGPLR